MSSPKLDWKLRRIWRVTKPPVVESELLEAVVYTEVLGICSLWTVQEQSDPDMIAYPVYDVDGRYRGFLDRLSKCRTIRGSFIMDPGGNTFCRDRRGLEVLRACLTDSQYLEVQACLSIHNL